MRVVAVDIGNSATKVLIDDSLIRIDASLNYETQFSQLSSAIESARETQLFWSVCSVDRKSATRLESWITENRSDDVWHLISENDIPLESDVANRTRLGRDRLLAAWHANQLFDGKSLVVVDAGTAVTIDVVSQNLFAGGLIFPGTETCLQAISGSTDALPDLTRHESPLPADWRPTQIEIGCDTDAAILLGVYQHQLFGILGIVQQLQQQYAATVVCTGGAMSPFQAWLPSDWKLEPKLVLEGAAALADLLIMGQQG